MKILVIRFSSFGDVTQCLSVPSALLARYPGSEIHFVTRSDLAILLKDHPAIQKIWPFDRKSGLKGLWHMAGLLRDEGFDLVYDAHNNARSKLIVFRCRPSQLVRRPTKRLLRWLLFNFRINLFEKPFSGQRDLLEPLAALGIPKESPPPPQIQIPSEDMIRAISALGPWAGDDFITCAPSSAHALKRWPVAHWKKLIELLPQKRFVLLGGNEDTFIQDIADVAPERTLNLAGRCSLLTSAAVVEQSRLLVTNDTGLLHVAEQRGKPAIALMGPAPFGFPSRPTTRIMQLDLPCRPCSKHGQGPCYNEIHQRCLVDITPKQIASLVQGMD